MKAFPHERPYEAASKLELDDISVLPSSPLSSVVLSQLPISGSSPSSKPFGKIPSSNSSFSRPLSQRYSTRSQESSGIGRDRHTADDSTWNPMTHERIRAFVICRILRDVGFDERNASGFTYLADNLREKSEESKDDIPHRTYIYIGWTTFVRPRREPY